MASRALAVHRRIEAASERPASQELAPGLALVRGGCEPPSADAGFPPKTGDERNPEASRRWAFTGPVALVVVDLVRGHVLGHLGDGLGAARLSRAAGVSESTLRRAVRSWTGLGLAQFVLELRLEQARAWLSSNREARTQAQIAAALGWRSGPAFSRAYRRRFGESMAQTRRRAVVGG